MQCSVTMCCEGSVDHVLKTSTLTRHRRSWKVMENTPQKVMESPGKPP